MDNLTLNDLVNKINEYNSEETEYIIKAYKYAEKLHSGQKRASGEEYITHPLHVAYILAEMHADRDTICAGLLHDTLEDTKITKDQLAHDFNPNIASLVDGVTKFDEINFATKEAQNLANTKKIITGIMEDPRIIIIKLADRLHNMRTLEFKSEAKRIENAKETLDIFVPLAYYIGAYRIKSELEDLALKYLNPDSYRLIATKKTEIEINSQGILREMLGKIKRLLEDRNIPNEIKIRTKNIYGIYQKLNEGECLSDIHDLLALKVMVDEVDNCYRTLGIIHQEYYPINSRFKDYICSPKTNMYRSLHTTVFGPGERLVQTQIRTFAMDKIDSFGITAYWDAEKGNAKNVMLADLEEKFQFFQTLKGIKELYPDNKDFVTQVKKELFSKRVYVNTLNGHIYELPKGANIIDLAYKVNADLASIMIGALVNNQLVPIDYVLNNKDMVKIVTDPLAFSSKKELLAKAYTSSAKLKILQFFQGQKN